MFFNADFGGDNWFRMELEEADVPVIEAACCTLGDLALPFRLYQLLPFWMHN